MDTFTNKENFVITQLGVDKPVNKGEKARGNNGQSYASIGLTLNGFIL